MTTSQSWYVIAGNFRILCHTQDSVQEWVSYIIARGGAPIVEPGVIEPAKVA
jgi:hypothetical protein